MGYGSQQAGRGLEEPGWGHSLGPEQPLPVSLLLCPLVPDPNPCPGQGSIIVPALPCRVPGPCGAGGKQVKFNGEWRLGRGKPCEAAWCHRSGVREPRAPACGSLVLVSGAFLWRGRWLQAAAAPLGPGHRSVQGPTWTVPGDRW